MSLATPLRIDTAIRPTSHLRFFLYMSLTAVLVLLAWLAPLVLWQYVFVLVVAATVVIYLTMSRPIVLHLSQPPLSQRMDRGWQLLLRSGRGDELWQAQLNAVHRYQWLIVFEFMITEPYHRALTVSVFRDQVSPEQWRELNILANVGHTKT